MKTQSKESPQTVSPSQWLRLGFVYLLIPLLLFLCAGDHWWWQAWVYAALILFVGIGGRVWAERRHPGLTAERQSAENLQSAKAWDKVLAPLMAVSISYPMVLVAGLDHRYGWSPEFPVWTNLLGLMLIAVGYFFSAWSVAENQFFYSVVCVRTDKGHSVCDTGPYRYVRHPGYAGNILALFGLVLALNTLWTLIPAVVATLISVIRTALEDRTLQEELPGYSDYVQRVRYRLFPGIY